MAQQDFVRQAFKSLFETQTDVGTWRHYAPLFHYQETGNAYCYIFETLSELLKCAMFRDAVFVRSSLRPYFDRLMLLLTYARSTKTILADDAESENGAVRPIGWSSGHRVKSSKPESWATASVFSYAEGLRRLVGMWARESALEALPKKATFLSVADAELFLKKRTQTWTSEHDLTAQLYSMFINQVGLQPFDSLLDPDTLPIGEAFLDPRFFMGRPVRAKPALSVVWRALLAGIMSNFMLATSWQTDCRSSKRKQTRSFSI